MIAAIADLRTALRAITLDNGTEFHDYERVEKARRNRIARALNNRPRLRLGLKTPSEVLFARPGGLALQS